MRKWKYKIENGKLVWKKLEKAIKKHFCCPKKIEISEPDKKLSTPPA